MAMTYTSLSAAKGTSGALATHVDYTKLDVPVIIDEAQALLYGTLRTREMRTDTAFTIPVGGSFQPLPARFLDPIGRIHMTSVNLSIRQKDENFLQVRTRNYTELSGTLGTNPFTTTSGSNIVVVNLPGHGFSQDSLINTSGATLFNGVTINGTFPISSVIDTNNFNIDITSLGTTPSGSSAGGGSVVAYICDNLIQGMAVWFGIWNENIYFDVGFSQTTLCKMQYYQSLPLLSSTNQTNFLTNRYPHLLRTACMAAAADYMKDDIEYQKGVMRLQALVQQVNIENDMSLRGMELAPEIP
jgi:hypothetical protein